MDGKIHPEWCHVRTFPFMLFNIRLTNPHVSLPSNILIFFLVVVLIYMYCVMVIYGGETPSIFLFLNDLVSNRQCELPGEQLVCIQKRPEQSSFRCCNCIPHSSLTRLVLLLSSISHLYICSICTKCLHEHEQTSMEDMQNTLCVCQLTRGKTNTATSCISLHFWIL